MYIPLHSLLTLSYLQSDPFISNKLLQSYAGLFNYILWRREVNEEEQVVSKGNDQTLMEEVDVMDETDTEPSSMR